MAEHARHPNWADNAAAGQAEDPIYAALFQDAGCGVAVLDREGVITICNARLAVMLRHETQGTLSGVRLGSRIPESAEVHAEALARTLGERAPFAVDGPIGDTVTRTTYRPIEGADGAVDAALVTFALLPTNLPIDPGVIQLHAPLPRKVAALTTRERQVLRAIGRGLSTAEIAGELARSPKTVEGHRVSLGLKLGVSNRVQLARIAIRAGLVSLHETNPPTAPSTTNDENP